MMKNHCLTLIIGLTCCVAFSANSATTAPMPASALCAPVPESRVMRIHIQDADTGEPLIGASLYLIDLQKGGVADVNGNVILTDIQSGKYKAKISYVGYVPQTITLGIESFSDNGVVIKLRPEAQSITGVKVVGKARQNTDAAMMTRARKSMIVTDGISAQQFQRSGDRNASEVVKRVPGITLMDNRYVMVRGLNQRYNNIWMNGAPMPSSEADSRVFSFDLIPSDQLDNMTIVKSPAPEYPSDFSGGFILINTKDIPTSNHTEFRASVGVNTETHLHDFRYRKGGWGDFLGMDMGYRALRSSMPMQLDENDKAAMVEHTRMGFNNDWPVRNQKPLTNFSLGGSFNRLYPFDGGGRMGLLAAFSLSHNYATINNMANNRLDLYNEDADQVIYLKKFVDDRYTIANRLGALLNLSYQLNPELTFSWKNNFNANGANRFTYRNGKEVMSGEYVINSTEDYYNSRMVYTTQFGSVWIGQLPEQRLEVGLGYSYADNDRPDRRIVDREENATPGDPFFGKLGISEITRQFTFLGEHLASLKADYKQELGSGAMKPIIKTGFYAEGRQRKYDTRFFSFDMAANRREPNFMDLIYDSDPRTHILNDNHFNEKELFILEDVNWTNHYGGKSFQAAGYLGVQLPVGPVTLYGGTRYEYNRLMLDVYRSMVNPNLTARHNHTDKGFYPSLSTTWNITEDHQLRASWGRTVNRPEFREVSPSVYYDFDLFSDVSGNVNLKPAYVHNLDLRYEWYPAPIEKLSLALFYKHFTNPIEWSYIVSGGAYRYFFKNAEGARNYGLELEVRKNLKFMGLPDFTVLLNGTLVESRVTFGKDKVAGYEHDRPMQGLSPYIINAGIFYAHRPCGINAALLFNRIGKRIVGVGMRSMSGTEQENLNNSFPDSYEMPRNMLDFNLGWQVNDKLDFKLGLRNLLNGAVIYREFPRFYDAQGKLQEREQTTRRYQTGLDVSLSVAYKL